MTFNSENFNQIFQKAIQIYHIKDDVNQSFVEADFAKNSLDSLLYKKCWIDTVQWHYEDLIRDPNINPEEAIILKRKIDASNQDRTDLVELIDDYFFDYFKEVKISKEARINTESIGWAIDRLSILNLKVFHWKEESERKDASEQHILKSIEKLDVLNAQYLFLTKAINYLIEDMSEGKVIAQTFKQMKMYNDPETNPILRASKK
ncbi:MAG: DUF4254 domain-containing protein [Bacteroidales bacterium]|nr:DUF4254 domain-containing protein [Bacteroidales bacterium]